MNDYEDYQKKQSGNGTYGQFIKKLNQDKSIKSPTELKKYIDEVYTKEQLILDLENNNDYKATLEALLKHRLSTRVESESEIENSLTNSSNNTIREIQKKITLPFKFSEISDELKNNSQTKEFCIKTYKIKENKYTEFIDFFIGLNSDHSDNEIVCFKEWNKHFKEWMKYNYNKLPEQQEQKQKAKLL